MAKKWDEKLSDLSVQLADLSKKAAGAGNRAGFPFPARLCDNLEHGLIPRQGYGILFLCETGKGDPAARLPQEKAETL